MSIQMMLLGALCLVGARSTEETHEADSLTVCLGTDAHFDPVMATESLPDTVNEFSAAFVLEDNCSIRRLTASLVALDVADAAPPGTRISQVDQAVEKIRRGRFRFSLTNHFPVGKYELDVLADGKAWKQVRFQVVHADVGDAVASAEALWSLPEGARWTYAFVQEAGEGAKIEGEGLKIGDDGKLRAETSILVGSADANGTHVEVRRDGELVTEEWWKLDPSGLLSTRRKMGEDTLDLDPPQPLFKLPCKGFTAWNYSPKDNSFLLKCKEWGPIDVNGPKGKERAYVVLFEQEMPLGRLSAVRTFVPGVGMVRETIETVFNGKVASWQEMVLKR